MNTCEHSKFNDNLNIILVTVWHPKTFLENQLIFFIHLVSSDHWRSLIEDLVRWGVTGNVVTRTNENIFLSTVFFTAFLRESWKGGVLYNLSCIWMLRDYMMNQGMSSVEWVLGKRLPTPSKLQGTHPYKTIYQSYVPKYVETYPYMTTIKYSPVSFRRPN